jgi:hypothetical protein
MRIWLRALLAGLSVAPGQAAAHQPRPTAFFGFTLQDTSLQGEMQGARADEAQRLVESDNALQDMLVRSGCCVAVDLAQVAARASAQDLQSCAGCEVDLAHEAGAEVTISGRVQKVSNLILNMNVIVRDVTSGRVIDAGSVDIRGNTSESWSRAVAYLVRNRLQPAGW